MRRRTLVVTLLIGGLAPSAVATTPAAAQEPPTVGKEAVDELSFPPLRFEAPRPELLELPGGIPLLVLEDPTLPLVRFTVTLRGGIGHFDRSRFGAASALASLMRSGGTRTLPPDSVDGIVDFYALGLSFGSGVQSLTSSVTTLVRHRDRALALWGDLLLNPRFDGDQIEIWRGQELERLRRRRESPMSLAISQFNHLVYGDHYVGWVLGPGDLEPEDLSQERLRAVHREVVCRENAVFGVVGDITVDEAMSRIRGITAGWPACPRELGSAPVAELAYDDRVYVMPREIEQSVVIVGQPGGVRQAAHPDYFASRIANRILGGGGLSNRLFRRIRSEEGYAYGVASFWNAGPRAAGPLGAQTRTRSEATVAATRAVLEVMDELRREGPTAEEVERARNATVNGSVFAYERPAQILTRRMLYRSVGLPPDWLEIYLDGIRSVDVDAVARVLEKHLDPERMTIFIVGDTAAFDARTLGEVRVIPAPRSSTGDPGGARSPPGSTPDPR